MNLVGLEQLFLPDAKVLMALISIPLSFSLSIEAYRFFLHTRMSELEKAALHGCNLSRFFPNGIEMRSHGINNCLAIEDIKNGIKGINKSSTRDGEKVFQ